MRRLFTALLLTSSIIINAQSSTAFDEVLNTVAGNSLSVRYTEAGNAASLESLKAENTLEAPEIEMEHLWGMKGIGSKRNISISQSFDWPGVYSARREAIRKSESAMQYLRESAVLETRMEVRLLLIDIINVRQRLDFTQKIRDGLKELADYYKKAADEGNETRLDYNKAVIELINSERELKSLKGEYAVLASSLRALNGGEDVTALLEKLGSAYPHPDLESLRPDRETLRAKDPSIAASRASIEAQKSLVKVEKRSLYPGFSIGYVHEWEMDDHFNGVTLSISLPFLTQRRKAKAAALQLKALDLEQEMSLIKIAAELQGEYDTALELRELIRQYMGVIDGDSNFTLLKKALDAGQINFLTYMQELNYFLSARRDFLEAHYRYHQSLARLQRYE